MIKDLLKKIKIMEQKYTEKIRYFSRMKQKVKIIYQIKKVIINQSNIYISVDLLKK